MPDRGRERDFDEFEDDRPRRMRRSDDEWRRERNGFRGERERGRMAQSQMDEDEERGQRGRRNGVDRGARNQPLGVASAFSETYVTALERSASLFGNNLRLWQGETMRFMSERLERDAEVMEQMGHAKNLFDLFAIHQRWLNELATSYSQEFVRLSKLTTSTAEEGVAAGRSVGRRMNEAGEEFAEGFREQARSMGEQQSMQ